MNFLSKFASYWKAFLTGFGIYLSIVGFFGFSLFICEEAIQTIMFSTWQAQDVNRWETVMESTSMMETINHKMVFMNNMGGWLNPMMWVSYDAYSDATNQYIKSLRQKIFANEPQYLNGHNVYFEFMPKKYIYDENSREYNLYNNKICVVISEQTSDKYLVEMVQQMVKSGHFHSFEVAGEVSATDSFAVVNL
jgi:hypothetical protein